MVESLIRGEQHLLYLPPTVECIYLQLRNVLELIATASLVVNESDDGSVTERCRRKWHAGDILAAVETVNPDYYYPQPTRLIAKDHSEGFKVGVDGYRGQFSDFMGDYLTRERFTTLYDICSKVVHTPNPFDNKALVRNAKSDIELFRQAPKWHRLIVNLLAHHQFKLSDDKEMLYVCHTDPNRNFQIASFQRMNIGEITTPRAAAKMRADVLASPPD